MGNRVEFLKEQLAEFVGQLQLCKQLYGDKPTEDQTEQMAELQVAIHQVEDTLVFVEEAHTSTPSQLAKALIDVVKVGSPRFEGDTLQRALNNVAWVTIWGLNAIGPVRDTLRKAMRRPQTRFADPALLEELVDHFVTPTPNPEWMLPRVDLAALAA